MNIQIQMVMVFSYRVAHLWMELMQIVIQGSFQWTWIFWLDADVDGVFTLTADADLMQIQGDKDIFVDEVMDVDGVVADVDTGVNVVTTATSLTP